MGTQHVTLGIDFEFRPKSYWGTEQLRRAKQLGTYDGIVIDEATARKTFFGLKPHLRSGIDLPRLGPTEVEIVRLRLAETIHEEVTSIRARRVGRRIAYRIVDEVLSECGYVFEFTPGWSSMPLTFGKLIEMIDNVEVFAPDGETFPRGLVVSAWEHQLNECENTDPESLKKWIDVSSVFYPQLKTYYGHVFEEWAKAKGLTQPPKTGPSRM